MAVAGMAAGGRGNGGGPRFRRQVLDGEALALGAGQAGIVLSALEDASEGIRERAAYCPACRSHPADLCEEDAERLGRADAYDQLADRFQEVMP
jgi:hypothetical protein